MATKFSTMHEDDKIYFPHDEEDFYLCPFSKLTKEAYGEGKWNWGGGSLFRLYIDVEIPNEKYLYNRYYVPDCFRLMMNHIIDKAKEEGRKEIKHSLKNLRDLLNLEEEIL